MDARKKASGLVGLCLLGWVLLNYPVLALFNVRRLVFGIPLLYVYLFGVWAALILLSAWIVSSDRG